MRVYPQIRLGWRSIATLKCIDLARVYAAGRVSSSLKGSTKNNSDGCRPLQSIVLSCEQVSGTLRPSRICNAAGGDSRKLRL